MGAEVGTSPKITTAVRIEPGRREAVKARALKEDRSDHEGSQSRAGVRASSLAIWQEVRQSQHGCHLVSVAFRRQVVWKLGAGLPEEQRQDQRMGGGKSFLPSGHRWHLHKGGV